MAKKKKGKDIIEVAVPNRWSCVTVVNDDGEFRASIMVKHGDYFYSKDFVDAEHFRKELEEQNERWTILDTLWTANHTSALPTTTGTTEQQTE